MRFQAARAEPGLLEAVPVEPLLLTVELPVPVEPPLPLEPPLPVELPPAPVELLPVPALAAVAEEPDETLDPEVDPVVPEVEDPELVPAPELVVPPPPEEPHELVLLDVPAVLLEPLPLEPVPLEPAPLEPAPLEPLPLEPPPLEPVVLVVPAVQACPEPVAVPVATAPAEPMSVAGLAGTVPAGSAGLGSGIGSSAASLS
jgi:hypothetical protein